MTKGDLLSRWTFFLLSWKSLPSDPLANDATKLAVWWRFFLIPQKWVWNSPLATASGTLPCGYSSPSRCVLESALSDHTQSGLNLLYLSFYNYSNVLPFMKTADDEPLLNGEPASLVSTIQWSHLLWICSGEARWSPYSGWVCLIKELAASFGQVIKQTAWARIPDLIVHTTHVY